MLCSIKHKSPEISSMSPKKDSMGKICLEYTKLNSLLGFTSAELLRALNRMVYIMSL
jgi:hypothetical protein